MRQLLFRISDDFKFVNVSKKKKERKNFTRKNTRKIQQKENIVVIII